MLRLSPASERRARRCPMLTRAEPGTGGAPKPAELDAPGVRVELPEAALLAWRCSTGRRRPSPAAARDPRAPARRRGELHRAAVARAAGRGRAARLPDRDGAPRAAHAARARAPVRRGRARQDDRGADGPRSSTRCAGWRSACSCSRRRRSCRSGSASSRRKAGIAARTTEREGEAVWRGDGVVVASLATARMQRTAPAVQAEPWDLVIVDEAHRVKRRGSASWKLVDGLRSRFLLLLTATPIETELEELYQLVTLLKPGQFATPAAFRQAVRRSGEPDLAEEPRGAARAARRGDGAQHARVVRAQAAAALRVHGRRRSGRGRARAVRGGDGRAAGGESSRGARRTAGLLVLEAGSSPAAVRGTLDKVGGARRSRRSPPRRRGVDETRKGRALRRHRAPRAAPRRCSCSRGTARPRAGSSTCSRASGSRTRRSTASCRAPTSRPRSPRSAPATRRCCLDRRRQRGSQPAALPPARQLRPAVEPDGDRAADRPAAPVRPDQRGRGVQPVRARLDGGADPRRAARPGAAVRAGRRRDGHGARQPDRRGGSRGAPARAVRRGAETTPRSTTGSPCSATSCCARAAATTRSASSTRRCSARSSRRDRRAAARSARVRRRRARRARRADRARRRRAIAVLPVRARGPARGPGDDHARRRPGRAPRSAAGSARRSSIGWSPRFARRVPVASVTWQAEAAAARGRRAPRRADRRAQRRRRRARRRARVGDLRSPGCSRGPPRPTTATRGWRWSSRTPPPRASRTRRASRRSRGCSPATIRA